MIKYLVFAYLLMTFNVATAQENLDNLQKQFFVDAKESEFSVDGLLQVFSGDAVIVSPAVSISADSITINRNKQYIEALGNITLLQEQMIMRGEKLFFDLENNTFTIEDATLYQGNPEEIQKGHLELLGVSKEDIEYEKKRTDRIKKLKNNIKQTQDPEELKVLSDQLKLSEKYTIVEKKHFINSSFKSRLKFWIKQPKPSTVNKNDFHFKLQGNKIQRINENEIRSKNIKWSPCLCNQNSSPDWSLSTNRFSAKKEGYADFYQSIFYIKDVPILYLPYLRLPTKTKRQTGLLFPTFFFDKDSGTTIEAPIFININNKSDITLFPTWYQQRGFGLGIEARYQRTTNSGWSVRTEYLNDRKREELTKNSPHRTHIEWQGLEILTSRWSFISSGTYYADHMHNEELVISKSFSIIEESQRYFEPFYEINQQLKFSGENFSLSLGSYYGDHTQTEKSFENVQKPVYIALNTRYFSLLNIFSRPLYFQSNASVELFTDSLNSSNIESGNWIHLKPEISWSKNILRYFQLHTFLNGEIRHIQAGGYKDRNHLISTYRSGASLKLKSIGRSHSPKWLKSIVGTNTRDTSSIEHRSSLELGVSVRPNVVRNTNYGIGQSNLDFGTYKLSDRGSLYQDFGIIDDKEQMSPHQRAYILWNNDWAISKSAKSNSSKTFAEINLGIEYDALIEREGSNELEPLLKPWSEPIADISIFTKYLSITSALRYNIFEKIITRANIYLSLNLNKNLTIGGKWLQSEPAFNNNQTSKEDYKKSLTKELSVNLQLWDSLKIQTLFGRQNIDNLDSTKEDRFQTQYALRYSPPSDCWALNFSRVKRYIDTSNNDATYLLQFEIDFGTEQHKLPNLLPNDLF